MGKRVSAVTVLALVALLMPILANGQRSRNFDERYNERYEVNERGGFFVHIGAASFCGAGIGDI